MVCFNAFLKLFYRLKKNYFELKGDVWDGGSVEGFKTFCTNTVNALNQSKCKMKNAG